MHPRSIDRRLIWGAMAIANAVALYMQWSKGAWLHHADGSVYAHDFIAFWAAGKQAVAGHASAVYDAAAQIAFQTQLIHAPKLVVYPFFYPPPFLFTTIPFAGLGLVQAYVAFLAVTAGLYALALRLLARDWAEASLAALAGGGAYFCILWVQNGFLTGALLVASLALLPTRPRLAGVFFGLLTIKPQLGLLVPIALIAGGYWRTFGWAAGTFVVLALSAELVFGPGIWAAFIRGAAEAGSFLQAGSIWFKMQTPFALTLRLLGPLGAYAVQAVFALMAAVIVWILWRDATASHWLKASALIAASMLISPYLFAYDAVPLTGAALMLLRANPQLPWPDQVALFAACLIPGFREVFLSAGVPLASMVIIVLVLRERQRTAGLPTAASAYGIA